MQRSVWGVAQAAVGDRWFEPHSGLQVSKRLCSSPLTLKRFNKVENILDREVAQGRIQDLKKEGAQVARKRVPPSGSAPVDRQGSNFESCVWRAVSSHHPQDVLLAQCSLYYYVHKGGLKPHSSHFISSICGRCGPTANRSILLFKLNLKYIRGPVLQGLIQDLKKEGHLWFGLQYFFLQNLDYFSKYF